MSPKTIISQIPDDSASNTEDKKLTIFICAEISQVEKKKKGLDHVDARGIIAKCKML